MAVCLLVLTGNAWCRDGTQADGEAFHMPRAIGALSLIARRPDRA
jgi:hypothetical protein